MIRVGGQVGAVDPLLVSFVESIADDDPVAAAEKLRRFGEGAGAADYPAQWLSETARCLETGEWGGLARPFADEDFVGPTGHFVLAGPYAVRRGDDRRTTLSAIVGHVIPHTASNSDIDTLVRETCGRIGQPVPHLLPVRPLLSCGSICGEHGEAFIVPDGWAWTESVPGPPLNDMTEQRRRFVEHGCECVRRIFQPESAELVVGALEDEEAGALVQHGEYQYHEAGHAAGIGLSRRLAEKCLPTDWHRGVEEWRADGVAFELEKCTMSPRESGKLVASNLCIRFGVDAHRLGGLVQDADATCSMLTLDRLLLCGALRIRGGGLGFIDPTYSGLARAVEALAFEAVQLTRSELGSEPSEIIHRYGTVRVQPTTCEIFRRFVVAPCQGVFPNAAPAC